MWNSHYRNPLHEFIRTGNLEGVKSLLTIGTDVNKKEDGQTALGTAFRKGHFEIAKTLIESGADVNSSDFYGIPGPSSPFHFVCGDNAKGRKGMSPLSVAARNGHAELVRLLLERGANLNEKCDQNCTPLHHALKNRHIGVALKLLESGAEVDEKDDQGMTPLISVAIIGNKELLITLIDRGVKLNEKCKNHRTALHHAVTQNHLEIVKILLEKGAAVNEKTDKGDSALHLACNPSFCTNGVEMIKTVLEHDPDLDAENNNGWTPMKIAGEHKRVDIMQVLVDAGAKIDREASYSVRLLHDVCDKKDLETVKKLLHAGVDINALDVRRAFNSMPPLHRAIAQCDQDFARFLLQNGANINARDGSRFSPLHYAGGGSKRPEILRFLINSGAYVNIRGNRGRTPLHEHCEAGDLDSVRMLFQYGACVNFNSRGDRPLHVVRGPQSAEIVKLLLQKGDAVDPTNFRGRTPLHAHCEYGNWDAVRVLISEGADVTKGDKDNNTPLHLVCKAGAAEILQLLCRKCPPWTINQKTTKGRIPLNRCCELGKLEYVKILLAFGASTNQTDGNGMTPLRHACNQKNDGDVIELLEVLLRSGANPNQKGRFVHIEEAPLHVVCRSGRIEAVRVLLKYGANLEDTNSENSKPIHVAGRSNHLETVQYLLQVGADVDATDGKGRTLLHFASERGNTGLAQILLERGSDVNKVDREGQSSIHYSVKSHHPSSADLVKKLLSKGANINLQDSLGNTVLHSCHAVPVDIMEIVLDAGFNVNLKNNAAKVPLLQCDSERMMEKARFLLEAGTKIQELIIDGKYLASFPNNIVAMLLDYGVGDIMCKCDKCQGDCTVMMCRNSYSIQLNQRNSISIYSYLSIVIDSYHDSSIFEKYSVKAELAGLKNPTDQFSALTDKDLLLFRNQCKKELVSMKSELIGDSCVTYFDLLRCQNHSTMHNKNLPWSLKSDLCRQKFPIYGDMIYSHFVPLRKTLIVEHCGSFFELAEIDLPWMPPECVAAILELLALKDLTNVAKICDAHRKARIRQNN